MSEAKARAILRSAKDARAEADRFQVAHDEVVAVFSAQMDDNHYAVNVAGTHPDHQDYEGPGTVQDLIEHEAAQPHLDKKMVKVFMPDPNTPEGLRAAAENVLDDLSTSHGSRTDLSRQSVEGSCGCSMLWMPEWLSLRVSLVKLQ